MRRAPVVPALLVLLLVAACGGSTPSGATSPSGPAALSPSAAPADGGSGGPASSEPPGASTPADTPGGSPVDTIAPGPTDSGTPYDTPSPSAASGAAAVCTGSAGNQAFYANLAVSVSWDVYCAVLPKGWVVASGSYRLANGGKLDISYRGPGGATLSLSEGSFCTDGSGCVPSGADSGSASFGQLPGTLVATDGGGFAIVVARGQQPSWLMVTGGLDQATTVAFGAALAKVSS
jgi:hypothetical protein